MTIMPGPTLYRIFDEADVLLYIGMSVNKFKRVDYHCSHQPWADEIACVRFERFADREELARAEIRAIRKEHPKYNRRHARRARV